MLIKKKTLKTNAMMKENTPYTNGFEHPSIWSMTHRRHFDVAEFRGNQFKNTDIVGMYVTERVGSDRRIVGRITGTYGKTGLIIQPMIAEAGEWKQEWQTGGFSAICTNQNEQVWNFKDSDEEPFKDRLTVGFLKENVLRHEPFHFYDYNF